MKQALWIAAWMLGVGVATTANAADVDALLKSNGCLNCHGVDQKKLGPAFKSIAQKYSGNADAEKMLIAKLKDGKGHKKIAAGDDDLKTLIDYVLAQ